MSGITSKIIELDGSTQTVKFDNKAPYFSVKNFSDEEIYVSFESPTQDDKTVIIPKNFGSIVFSNVPKLYLANDEHDTIYIMGTGSGMVEVLPLWQF